MATSARKLNNDDRGKLLQAGYRPLEIWVPETTNAAYRSDADRQARAAAAADVEDRVIEWIEAAAVESWDDL